MLSPVWPETWAEKPCALEEMGNDEEEVDTRGVQNGNVKTARGRTLPPAASLTIQCYCMNSPVINIDTLSLEERHC